MTLYTQIPAYLFPGIVFNGFDIPQDAYKQVNSAEYSSLKELFTSE